MRRAVILGGVGAVGIEASRDFISTSDFDEIIIADYNIKKARKFVEEEGDERVSAVKIDVNELDALRNLIKDVDLVINALPFKYDYIVTKIAVEEGVSGVDVATEEDQFDLHEKALSTGSLFVPGVGATPGTTNLMAKKAVELLDNVDTIEIFWAAFRCTAPSPGLLHVTIWEFDPNLKERVVYEDGVWRQVPPYVGAKKVEFFPLIGVRETVFVPHSETYTLPKYLPEDKRPRKVYVRGTWPEETMNLLKVLLYYGFYEDKPVDFGGVLVKPMSFIYKYLLQSEKARETEIWGYGLRVEAVGWKDGERVKAIVMNEHPYDVDGWEGMRAYFRPIGNPLSIGAQLIARGDVEKDRGVYPPEAVFRTDTFFYELRKRGIQITWRIEYL